MGDMRDFDTHGKCPICKQWFRGAKCRHSVTDVREHFADERVRKIVREEVARVLDDAQSEES